MLFWRNSTNMVPVALSAITRDRLPGRLAQCGVASRSFRETVCLHEHGCGFGSGTEGRIGSGHLVTGRRSVFRRDGRDRAMVRRSAVATERAALDSHCNLALFFLDA